MVKRKKITITDKDVEAIVEYATFKAEMTKKIRSALKEKHFYWDDELLNNLTSEAIFFHLGKRRK